MKFLLIGDIVGSGGVEYLKTHLNSIRNMNGIDFVVANAENSSNVGKGISKEAYETMYSCGVDIFTMGNHTYNNKDVYSLFDQDCPIIRPANLPSVNQGEGYITVDIFGTKITVINLMGRVFMNDLIDCPFKKADEIIEKVKDETDIILVDFHAEATSEKLAMGFYLDGRVSAVFGTHTHVQTADQRVLENGTAYITDLGMTGCKNSVLGVKKEIIIKKFLSGVNQYHSVDNDSISLNGAIVDIDQSTGKATNIELVNME